LLQREFRIVTAQEMSDIVWHRKSAAEIRGIEDYLAGGVIGTGYNVTSNHLHRAKESLHRVITRGRPASHFIWPVDLVAARPSALDFNWQEDAYADLLVFAAMCPV
jgi:hypothetical protein